MADQWISSLNRARERFECVKRNIACLTSHVAVGNAELPVWLVLLREGKRDVEEDLKVFEQRAENCARIEVCGQRLLAVALTDGRTAG